MEFYWGKDGRNVKEDSYEGARVYNKLKPKWEGKEVDTATYQQQKRAEYKTFLKSRDKIVVLLIKTRSHF
jgi:hypothetical protein